MRRPGYRRPRDDSRTPAPDQDTPIIETLHAALTRALGVTVVDATYEERELHGGTLGNVRLLTGTAVGADGRSLPFEVVWKTQHRWERHGDPDSWRREYDLYASGLGELFGPGLRWPLCHLATLDEVAGRIDLVMEHAVGRSGSDLTAADLERAALALGRFQGRVAATSPAPLQDVNLSSLTFVNDFYWHYRSWPRVHDAVRSEASGIPAHLRRMITSIDDDVDAVFARIERLPVVLCHRDFWVANIIDTGDVTILIDWDTTGWGRAGEDIASLVADEADVDLMVDLFHRCVPAYYRGLAEHVDIAEITDRCVWELIVLMFGYRLVEWYLDASSPSERAEQLAVLEQIHRMRPGALQYAL